MSHASVLAVLVAMRAHHLDTSETIDERRARLDPVAQAIARHARTNAEAALMLASGWHESKWARSVGPTGKGDFGLSVGFWQSQRRTCPGAWVADPEAALNAGAECAARILRGGWLTCYTPGGAFMRYNGSHSCEPAKWTAGRVSTFWWSLQRLRHYDRACVNRSADLFLGYDHGVACLRWHVICGSQKV